MTEAMQTAERMRRVTLKETKELAIQNENTPANYIDPITLNSITSFKGKDKAHAEKLVVRTLLDMIMNGKEDNVKLKAIDRYIKLTQSSQLLIKNGSTTAAIETQSDGPTTLNIDLSSHIKSDEPEETFNITSRDLVAEKNEKIFEDATFEVIHE